MIVVLEAGGITIPVGVHKQSKFTSKHTGKELRRLTGDVVAQGAEQQNWFQGVLKNADKAPLAEHETSQGDGGTWLVKQRSYSYAGADEGDTRYNYTLELEEYEPLKPEQLIVGPLSFVPIKYEEEFSGDALTIRTVVRVLPEQTSELVKFLEEAERLRSEGKYFEVRRPGINDDPRQMRFGQTWWSEHPEGNKYSFVLVDEAYDRDSTVRWRLGLEHDAAAASTAYYASIVDGILSRLVERGIMTEQGVEDLKGEARDKIWGRVHRYYRVLDAEED
jgi:hypothetical protein